jgi:hypothetical protein
VPYPTGTSRSSIAFRACMQHHSGFIHIKFAFMLWKLHVLRCASTCCRAISMNSFCSSVQSCSVFDMSAMYFLCSENHADTPGCDLLVLG